MNSLKQAQKSLKMRIKNKVLNERIFYGLLAFCIISLPFPDYSLSTKAIIGLVGYWLFFYNSIFEKKELLKKNITPFILLSSLFWVPLLGSVYSDDLIHVLKELKMKSPFLLLPLVIFSVPLKNCRKFTLNHYIIGLVAASILALSKAWYFKFNQLGEYLFYDRFAEFLNRHTTYYALFVVVGLLWLLWLFLHEKANRILIFCATLLLVYMLYLLSVRISIVALLFGSLLIILGAPLKLWQKISIFIIIPGLFLSAYLTPNFQNRFDPSTTDTTEIHDLDYRQLHWKSVWETITHNNIWIGNGTNAHRDFLYQKYRDYELTAGYKNEYNAHNQYLETMLDFGIIGLIIFVGLLLYLLRVFIQQKDYFALSIFSVFLIFMITESLLQRTNGIVLFAFLMPFFLSLNTNKMKIN